MATENENIETVEKAMETDYIAEIEKLKSNTVSKEHEPISRSYDDLP